MITHINKILNTVLIIIVVSLLSGCAIGFKNGLTWERSKNYKAIIGQWKNKKDKAIVNELIIKEKENNLIFTFLSSKKNSKPNICAGKFLEDKNIKIIQIDMSSCSAQKDPDNIRYKYLILKVKQINKNEMYLIFLNTKKLGAIIANNNYKYIDKKIVEMCKKEMDRSLPMKENEVNPTARSFKYSSFEHCLAVNLGEENLSILIKKYNNEIFNNKNNLFYFIMSLAKNQTPIMNFLKIE